MTSLSSLIFCALLCISYAHGWHQPDSEYNEDSLAMIPASSWKENSDKRNTWWTKKSISDEELGNDLAKFSQEHQTGKKAGFSMERCMVLLMNCLKTAENKTLYLQCKDFLASCLASFFQKYKERLFFNSVAMTA